MTWQPSVGSVVDVLAGQNPPKIRPGVVIRITGELVTVCHVAHGTGTLPEQRRRQGDAWAPSVAVGKDSSDGRALALDKDTWFYQGERKEYEASEVSPRSGASTCPAVLLARLRELHRG